MARTSAGAGASLSTGGLLRSMGTSWMAASTPMPATRIHRRRLTLRLFVFSSGNSHSEFPSSSAGGIMAAKPTQRTRKGAVPVSRYRPRESRARPRERTPFGPVRSLSALFRRGRAASGTALVARAPRRSRVVVSGGFLSRLGPAADRAHVPSGPERRARGALFRSGSGPGPVSSAPRPVRGGWQVWLYALVSRPAGAWGYEPPDHPGPVGGGAFRRRPTGSLVAGLARSPAATHLPRQSAPGLRRSAPLRSSPLIRNDLQRRAFEPVARVVG